MILKTTIIFSLTSMVVISFSLFSACKRQGFVSAVGGAPPVPPNLDIDGDGKPDQLLFDFTGGAHCCYRPSIKLSSIAKIHEFPFNLDGGGAFRSKEHFQIKDFDGDGRDEIYMRIYTYSDAVNSIPGHVQRRFSIRHNYVIFDFEKGTLNVFSFPLHTSVEQFFLSRSLKSEAGQMIRIKKGKKVGVRGQDGNTLILPELDEIWFLSDVLLLARRRDTYMFLNRGGRIIHDFGEYAQIPVKAMSKDGLVLVDTGGDQWAYFNGRGHRAIGSTFAGAKPFSEGLAAVVPANGKDWGYIDTKGRWIIKPGFQSAAGFKDGQAIVSQNGATFKIDRSGRRIRN